MAEREINTNGSGFPTDTVENIFDPLSKLSEGALTLELVNYLIQLQAYKLSGDLGEDFPTSTENLPLDAAALSRKQRSLDIYDAVFMGTVPADPDQSA